MWNLLVAQMQLWGPYKQTIMLKYSTHESTRLLTTIAIKRCASKQLSEVLKHFDTFLITV